MRGVIAFTQSGPVELGVLFVFALYGVYCCLRAALARPPTASHVPFFSKDPRLITPDGIKWRKRYYLIAFFLVFYMFGRELVLMMLHA